MAGDMAPWDELKYFQAPQQVTVSVPAGAPSQVFIGDPQCVLLVFSNCGTSGTIFLSISNLVTANNGIQLQATSDPLIINKSDFGNITTVPWYAAGLGAGPAVSVLSVALKEWPTNTSVVQTNGLRGAIQSLSDYIRSLANRG